MLLALGESLSWPGRFMAKDRGSAAGGELGGEMDDGVVTTGGGLEIVLCVLSAAGGLRLWCCGVSRPRGHDSTIDSGACVRQGDAGREGGVDARGPCTNARHTKQTLLTAGHSAGSVEMGERECLEAKSRELRSTWARNTAAPLASITGGALDGTTLTAVPCAA